MDSLPEAQLYPDLRCPALCLLLAGDVIMKTTLARLPPLFGEKAA